MLHPVFRPICRAFEILPRSQLSSPSMSKHLKRSPTGGGGDGGRELDELPLVNGWFLRARSSRTCMPGNDLGECIVVVGVVEHSTLARRVATHMSSATIMHGPALVHEDCTQDSLLALCMSIRTGGLLAAREGRAEANMHANIHAPAPHCLLQGVH